MWSTDSADCPACFVPKLAFLNPAIFASDMRIFGLCICHKSNNLRTTRQIFNTGPELQAAARNQAFSYNFSSSSLGDSLRIQLWDEFVEVWPAAKVSPTLAVYNFGSFAAPGALLI